MTAESTQAAPVFVPEIAFDAAGLPAREAAEIERRVEAFELELDPTGEVGMALVRHAATMSVRMERCAKHANAVSAIRVRRAIAGFVPPEGASEDEANRLRDEAGTLALFDASAESTIARKYELAAERGFLRALKEFRIVERALKAPVRRTEQAECADLEAEFAEALASFSTADLTDAELDDLEARLVGETSRIAPFRPEMAPRPSFARGVDVPIMIGKRR